MRAGGTGAGAPDPREAAALRRVETFRRRRPRLTDPVVTLAHGAGGRATATLVDDLFLEAFASPEERASALTDAALVDLPGSGRLAFTTDSFVVSPLRFAGGSIGHLAVNGTVNDLAMAGARPIALAAAFVLEEGLAIDGLRAVVADMAEAARTAGVRIVTGDTKVVERGAADQLYITTTGVGLVPPGRTLDAAGVRPGDRVVVSGPLGDHGVAVLLARGDLALEADVVTDTAALHDLVEVLLAAAPATRWLRDPTRGGLATTCNELARDTGLAIVLEETAIPVDPVVAGACDLLGLDPLYVANEGRLVAVVPAEQADGALGALLRHPLGGGAAVIGEVRAEPEGIVALRTAFGGTRIVDMLVGDPLPRIC